jgi:hypothetical protein
MTTKKLKPVVRWVVGACNPLGYDVLYESIINFKKIYKDKFLYCICYNSRQIHNKLKKSFNCVDRVFNQRKLKNALTYNPEIKKGPHWKLYPPRIFKNQHELILDNDIIVYEKIEQIEEFLSNEDIFITTRAIRRSYNKKYDNHIKQGFNINTGLVGLPPNFDYEQEILKIMKNAKEEWSNHFDEQTLVARILQNKKTIVIPFEILSSCCSLTRFAIGKKGTHFIGANKGYDKWWNEFKIKCL